MAGWPAPHSGPDTTEIRRYGVDICVLLVVDWLFCYLTLRGGQIGGPETSVTNYKYLLLLLLVGFSIPRLLGLEVCML